jgi:hypothetical protein
VGASAEKKKVNFPLQENSMTFKNKWIKTPLSAWDEYVYF